ncbi:MAG: ISL3 family transposase [Fimbriimonadaceae bacterium]
MLLKTILNRVQPHKSFVYESVKLTELGKRPVLEVSLKARSNSRPICSGCHHPGATYDRLPPRLFLFVPLWQIQVYFVYAMRRVNCRHCGKVIVEEVPWAEGKGRLTKAYQWFLARWAQRMSWQEVARTFHTTWDHVYSSVQYAVQWGVVHRVTEGVKAIAVDEIQWARGHQYLTLVYQIDAGSKRLLWVGKERTAECLRGFFQLMGESFARQLKFVCSDMWRAYLDVIAEQAPKAVHVLDRFHIMKLMNKAIDEVRREEVKRLKQEGYEPILKHSRWCLLKRLENMTQKQTVKLTELMRYNLQSMRAKLSRDDFQRFWDYESVGWATKFLEEWCSRTMRSKIEPMKKVARTLKAHKELILNWFRADGTISSGVVEGFNNKAKLAMRKAYGFRTYEAIQLALYHQLGSLPTPKTTHEFA